MTINDIQDSVSTPELLLKRGYKYIEIIGEGSNGKTYKAKNLKTGEIIAIKALKFSDNLKNYELFEREAQTLKSIHTPGTPVFCDYITSGSEFTECWLVQEYINGESIFDKLERGQTFDEAQTLETLMEAAQIIQTLQTKYTPPIIHRDIKPSNILIRETPKDDMKLCLIDFGAVANPQRRGVNSTVAGTVGYMAPEQLIGDCTIQSDYYALGATALHMLTAINPSEIPSDGFTLQFEEILKQKVPGIHKETIALLHKLLATNPTDRPKDANDLIQQIVQVTQSFYKPPKRLILKRLILKRLMHSARFRKFLNFITHPLFQVLAFLFELILGFTLTVMLLDKLKIDHYFTFFAITSAFLTIFLHVLLFSHLDSLLNNTEGDLYDNTEDYIYGHPKISEHLQLDVSDKPTNNQETGVIQTIHGDIIEYTYQKDKKYYTAFKRVANPYYYKVGDKITI